MLTTDEISKLRQTNVSTNGDLTKQRVNDIWKAATQEKKAEVEALSNLKRTAVARVYKTGAISAKIAVAMAQALGVDPSYLTGEVEEQGTCTDESLKFFLAAKGYKEEAEKAVEPSRKPRKQGVKPAKTSPPSALDEPQNQPEAQEQQMPQESIAIPDYSAIPEDETINLLRALIIKEKYSDTAKKTLNQVKALLIK